MPRKLQESVLDKIEKNDSRLIPVDAEDSLQNVDYPDYMFIFENTAVGDSPLKEGVSPELLEHTLAAFDVRFKIWYLDRFEYERIEEIDHNLDWKFNQKDYMTCIMFDYPDTVREQVKFIIQMMSVYWMSYWGYSDVLMYKFDGNIYLPMEDRTSELVAAANEIAGFAFYLTHSDAKRSFQYEGEELKKLKHKICAMLPDNSSYGYQQVSKIID